MDFWEPADKKKPMSDCSLAARQEFFLADSKENNRFWWHTIPGNDYLPLPFMILDDGEWEIMREWFEDTDRIKGIGECSVSLISLLIGLVMSSGIDSIVQLGNGMGYSTLLLSFVLRKMSKKKALFTVDIYPPACEYTQSWVTRAGLDEYVNVVSNDSSASHMVEQAREYLGHAPKLVFIDSSHQYEHTRKELDLWFDSLTDDGLMVLHDTSYFAAMFDKGGLGGVKKALEDWIQTRDNAGLINIFNIPHPEKDLAARCTYHDCCGVGIVQKTTYTTHPHNIELAKGA